MKYIKAHYGATWQGELPNNGYLRLENEGDTPTIEKNLTFHSNPLFSGYSKCPDVNPVFTKYSHSSVITRRQKRRIVLKNGEVNVSKDKVPKKRQRYLRDIFTTLVNLEWKWILPILVLSFILSWLGFAVIWWLIAKLHGDLDLNHIEDHTWNPCVMNLRSFTSAFLFSIETQHTIGYGTRYPTEECSESIFVICIQSVMGLMIKWLIAGIVVAKVSVPKKRSQSLVFSKNATVCLRDGKLCLMFRVGDMRKSHIIGAQINVQLIRSKMSLEGEFIPYYPTLLDIRFDNGGDRVFSMWPATIVHTIDSSSPFFDMKADEVLRDNYELVVILEGAIESTGKSVQVRSSYIPSEILWGQRFEQVVSYKKETGEYLVDYSKFNATYEVETPRCSAKNYYSYVKEMSMPSQANTFTRNIQ